MHVLKSCLGLSPVHGSRKTRASGFKKKIFSLILQLLKIAKAQAQYHTRCQYELVFSKWPTIVKISCGFLARSTGNSDFLIISSLVMGRKNLAALMG
jgi:hypothetical protein